MKTIPVLILLTISSILFFSCKKNSVSSASNQWTINGLTYTGESTVFDSYAGGGLWSVDTAFVGFTDYVNVAFSDSFTIHPVSGIYNVVTFSTTTPLANNQCMVTVSVGGQLTYSLAGGTVNTTVTGTKIAASFSNISVSANGLVSNGTVSGRLLSR